MTTTKKPLPKAVQDIRKVLLPNVCPLWQERILAARTVAACRKLWETANENDRHIAIQRAD